MSELKLPQVLTTVDVVLLTLKDSRLHVALFQREANEFAGHWALPGGFIDEAVDDDVGAAALRVLQKKTGINPHESQVWLEQLRVFSGKFRDPRRWSISVAHFALVPMHVLETSTIGNMMLVDVEKLQALPFDHNQIVKEAVERVRSKASYSSIATHLMPEEFTLSQLHAVQESVLDAKIDLSSFRRKIAEMDFLEEVPGKLAQHGRMKPAQLYRLKKEARKTLQIRERGLSN